MDEDKRLLEMAAKAYWGDEIDDVCSIEWSEKDQAIVYTHADNQDHNGQDRNFLWNPLTDDGDAFRLAMKLRIDIHFDKRTKDSPWMVCCDWDCDEPLDAPGCDAEITRRAIVRAAAAISESKE